jgi:sugar phosphate isomerase/epimerase
LRTYGQMATDAGVRISIEVHQGSIADNSWATLHLLDLVGMDSVGANPDLGNIYWQYEQPEETAEAAIVALAPRAVYWHCKNLRRVHIPDLHRAIFQRVPLADGDLDYRFAVSAMLDAGYQGYLAIEGVQYGDQLTQDRRSLDYVKELLGA